MKRLLSLACASLLIFLSVARAENGMLFSIDPPEEIVRPGKAVLFTFSVPQAGAVTLRLTNENGEVISTVVEDHQAVEGCNDVWWNGTYQGVFASEGEWLLELLQQDQSVTVPISVGPIAPYLTNVLNAVDVAMQSMTVSFYASSDGVLSVGMVVDDGWELLDSLDIAAGENTYVWQLADANPTITALTLTLTDLTGDTSSEERIPVLPEDLGLPQSTEAPDDSAADAPMELPSDESDLQVEEETLWVDEIFLDSDAEEQGIQSVFTPVFGSPYEGQDSSLNYWTLPMDITDEEVVWEVLMQPMTVLYSGVDKAERTQRVIREEPDENSRGVGVVTRMTQGVHVLETLDNGWSLIEFYSASFHDSAVKAWNMLVQGYVPTEELRVIEPQTEYGIVVDKLTQRLYLFKDGHLYSTLMVSTGLANARQPYNETQSGEYVLTTAVGAITSDNLIGAMGLRFNSGNLMHEVPYVTNADGSKNYGYTEPKLGTKASHGCIRVQRRRTPEGINMSWFWNNRVKNTKILIWEDWQGRQIDIPDDDFVLYYNPNGGTMYHSQETCYSASGKTFTPFTYGELDSAPYASLTRCTYCAPVLRRAEIEAINETYAPGGDHDPVMTEAQQLYLDSLND